MCINCTTYTVSHSCIRFVNITHIFSDCTPPHSYVPTCTLQGIWSTAERRYSVVTPAGKPLERSLRPQLLPVQQQQQQQQQLRTAAADASTVSSGDSTPAGSCEPGQLTEIGLR